MSIKPTSYIELSQSALANNLTFIRNIIGSEVEMVSVVKGNAYGHGISSYVPLAKELGVDSFAVFSTYEAQEVLHTHIKYERIIVMGGYFEDEIEWMISNGIEFFVYDVQILKSVIRAAAKLMKQAKIHVELETGLNRTGIDKDRLTDAATLITQNRQHLDLIGVCSHFSGAENISNYYRIKKQISSFNRMNKAFKVKGIEFENKHLACSAALINYPKTMLDMVRVGIMQYGFWPSKEVKMAYMIKHKNKIDPLKRVISWKSRVLSVKYVKEGEFVGYGNAALAETNMKTVIVPIGYGYGYSRSLSNIGRVLIKGIRLNVIGNVNMNMIIVDATNIDEVNIGDEVVLIGNQEDNTISVGSFSDLSEQLNYELLTRLPENIERKITL